MVSAAARGERRGRSGGRGEVSAPVDRTTISGALLHAEIGRLPERLRLPVELCDLEGLTRDQAAERLRWTGGTVRGRLAKARAKLRERLARRQVGLSSAGLAAALARGASAALVPEPLLTATVRAAAGQGATAFAALLTAQVVRSMFLARVKAGTIVALTAGAVAWASVVLLSAADERPNAPPAPQAIHRASQPPAPSEKDQDATTLVFHGRVADASDRPVAGAKLYLLAEYRQSVPQLPRATSGADGQFRFSVSTLDFADPTSREYEVLAKAEGFLLARSDWDEPAAGRDLTLRVVEDMPIEGRVIDLEGRPVVGATVTVTNEVRAPLSGDLTPWLRAIKAQEGDFDTLRQKYLRWWPPPLDDVEIDIVPPDIFRRLRPATTDDQGRFRLSGVGRESLAELRIEAPSIRVLDVPVMTRLGEVIRMPSGNLVAFADKPPVRGLITIYDASPRLVATPSRPIEGVVRDRATGGPIAGATVSSYFFADERTFNVIPPLSATSDASGHYRLTNMPRVPGNQLMVDAPDGEPSYLHGVEEVEDQPGLGPIRHDITLTRGILIEGRVTSKATGKPVTARVFYYAAADNPNLDSAPGFQRAMSSSVARQLRNNRDGTFQIVGLPGRGLLTATTEDDASDAYLFVDGGDLAKLTEYGSSVAYNWVNVFAKVDVPRGNGSFRQDLQVDPGQTLAGTVLDPDGQPLAGSFIYGLSNFPSWDATKGSSFEVRIKAPGVAQGAGMSSKDKGSSPSPLASTRTLVFQHEGRKLAGCVDVDEKTAGPLRVKLEPWSTVSGRVVDAAGEPRANLEFVTYLTDKLRPGDDGDGIEHRSERVRVDATGRFRIEGLVPGLRYEIFPQAQSEVFDETQTIKVAPTTPGESRDLGTLVIEFPDDQE